MILGFSTSGPFCAATVLRDAAVLAARHEEMARGQAERLMPMIADVLADAGAAYRDLVAIGVGVGPGNFTGIRISVAAARGLALALEIPAVGVSQFDALALGAPEPVLASVEGGRGRLHLQRFGASIARAPQEAGWDDLRAWAAPGLTCIGDRADEIAAHLGVRSAAPLHAPATAIAHIAGARWQDGPPRPVPLYIRPPDATPAAPPPALIG